MSEEEKAPPEGGLFLLRGALHSFLPRGEGGLRDCSADRENNPK